MITDSTDIKPTPHYTGTHYLIAQSEPFAIVTGKEDLELLRVLAELREANHSLNVALDREDTAERNADHYQRERQNAGANVAKRREVVQTLLRSLRNIDGGVTDAAEPSGPNALKKRRCELLRYACQ